MIVLNAIIYCLSTFGLWEIVRRRLEINIYFIPSMVISIQVCLLLFSGLLNCLDIACYLLMAIGLGRAFYYTIIRREIYRNYYRMGYLFLGIVMVLLIARLYGNIFSHYDNFSHWAIVVKEMLINNRMPSFQDGYIMFQSYPLGSSLFIYFFTRIVGNYEWVQMVAQAYIIVACILPMFAFVKRNKIMCSILIGLFTFFVFSYSIVATELLVDTLLPVVAMCCLSFVYSQTNKEKTPRSLLACSFYLIFIIQIKNSGIYFVVLIFAYIIWKKRMKIGLECLSISMISLLLWQRHWMYAFSGADISKHALSFAWLRKVFEEKNQQTIAATTRGLFDFAVTWKDAGLLLLAFLLIGVLIYRDKKHSKSNIFNKILILSIIMYVTYQVGLLCMYLFSMPGNFTEVDFGGENARYPKTILISIIYLLMVLIINYIEESAINLSKIGVLTVSVGLIFSLLYLSYGNMIDIFNWNYLHKKEWIENREWLERQKHDYNIPEGRSYCILIPKEDAGYMYHLGRYEFTSDDVFSISIRDSKEMDSINSEYLIINDINNYLINEWIAQNYPDQYGNRVIVVA